MVRKGIRVLTSMIVAQDDQEMLVLQPLSLVPFERKEAHCHVLTNAEALELKSAKVQVGTTEVKIASALLHIGREEVW